MKTSALGHTVLRLDSQNFIPSKMSDSTSTSLRLMEVNSGINKGYMGRKNPHKFIGLTRVPSLPYSLCVSSLA
jgi:hypothetical protein